MTILMIVDLFRRYKNRDTDQFLSPMVFIQFVLLYYVVIAPIFFISKGDTFYGGRDLAPFISISWIGAFISYLSMRIGYGISIHPKKYIFWLDTKAPTAVKRVYIIGVLFTLVGLVSYVTAGGFSLSQLLMLQSSLAQGGEDITMGGYEKQMISICLPGCSLMFLAYLRGYRSKFTLFLLVGLVIFSVLGFILAGFRYRIIYLLIAFFTIYYLVQKKRPNLFLWGTSFVLLVFLMGVIGSSRSYHQGLDLTRLEDNTDGELFERGMADTRIFYASGAVMENVRFYDDYIYFKPLYTAICMPIPRSWFKEKPDADYIVDMNFRIFGTADHGIAYMNYGEAFQSFGWLGIILNGLLMGLLARYVFSLYQSKPLSIPRIVYLALFNGFVYVFLSRGYLAGQVVTYLFIIVAPLFLYKKLV